MFESAAAPVDTAELRKARGAFFTPDAITRYITDWAIRSSTDTVLEPSAGDAAFLVQAVRRFQAHGSKAPVVDGVEIHEHSALVARRRVEEAGGSPNITVSDFFLIEPQARYSAVVGNPPYIRYQDFSGDSRTRSRAAALKAGVSLTALASSWAAFTVHSALFLKDGGRMGLVLPAELLSVNYAAAVRQFLFDRFRSVELVLFTERVFPEAEADVVLLLADGFNEGPTDHATIYQAQDAEALASLSGPLTWKPTDPSAKWTGLLVDSDAEEHLRALCAEGHFTSLDTWGDTTLGMVTGNNRYFALSPARVKELGLPRKDLVRLSPPGSSHLRGLELSTGAMTKLGQQGKSTWLFRPSDKPSPASQAYIDAGHLAGVDEAYKCRVRKPWYRVPLLKPADLLLTCMNADTPRLTTNMAGAHHLNSVHGVYLDGQHRELGRELLPSASLNSVTLLNAEMVGRSYGGGILKLEPREADVWAMPSPAHVQTCADQLRLIKPDVAKFLQRGDLPAAVKLVDSAVLVGSGIITESELDHVRDAHATLAGRRQARGRSGH
ncbi:HsdM family class I SAM-dependent methyltransferase [Corynebacterium flavescens]|uniref:Methyltransferase n=1 Tax=Corynebacterium flavescens TaxID=28028 RepID=A0A1L7CNT5_CORFL|nr:N-6 DNA methylase [Corynebacterium flavescens]APT87489.1 methyltransferase [Corynebacterium flavescens]KAA8720303.1 N-6 DNA methylase [Corynebacterium flavescens]